VIGDDKVLVRATDRLVAALALVSYIHPTIVGQNVRSCVLFNGIDLPPINQRWNARNLTVLLEVEERGNAELQVASDEVPDSALHFAVAFRIREYTAVNDPNAIRGEYESARDAIGVIALLPQ